MYNIAGVMMFMDAFLAKYWDRGDTARYHCERYAFLGEPSMPVWIGGMPESALVAGVPDSVGLGETVNLNLTVTTMNGGEPVEGALVCIAHEDVYQADRTDPDGRVNFSFTTQRNGFMTVTVSEGHAYHSQPGAQHTPILPRQDTIVCGRGAPWVEMEPMLSAPSGKAVKDGGWLSFDPGSNLIYGAKGNKSADFYRYHINGDSWHELTVIPPGTEPSCPIMAASVLRTVRAMST